MVPLVMCVDTHFGVVRGGTRRAKTSLVVHWLRAWLEAKAASSTRGAVVFDIDKTLVDEDEAAITAVTSLYQYCQRYFQCYIVTARPDVPGNRRLTEQMLAANTVRRWRKLYMMPENVHARITDEDSLREVVSRYKYAARCDIASRAGRILASISDTWHDLVRYPLTRGDVVADLSDDDCAIFFPRGSHGEAAAKLPS